MDECRFCGKTREEVLDELMGMPKGLRDEIDDMFKGEEIPFGVCSICYCILIRLIDYASKLGHLEIKNR